MEEIIYLEPDEEITSVIDKIKNAQNQSIGLVVPRDATLLQSVVNLRLLIREANSLQKQIAIVTTDKIGRNLAAQVGLPVYNSVKEDRPSSSPPPVSARDEVIEIDSSEPEPSYASNDAPSDDNSKRRSGPSVHHFQESRPVIRWKSNQRPQMQKKEPAQQVIETVKPEKIQSSNRDHNYPSQTDHKSGKIFWPIFAILLILAGAAAYLLWPAATISVLVKADNLDKTLPIIFTNAVTNPDPTQNVFPGLLIVTSSQSTQKFSATGTKNLGGKASGQVTITNGLDSLAHKLPAGTKLMSQNKTYLLKTAITVPGATVQNLQVVPGSIAAQIEAENAGEDYNIKAGKFVIAGLPANQQSAIYAQASTDLTGGFTKVTSVVSQADYDNAQKKITDSLMTNLDQDLKTKAAGLTTIDKAVVLSDPEINSSSKVDQEATDFEMTVKLTKQVMAYDNTKLNSYLVGLLSKQVSSDKMVAIASNSDINFTIDKQAYDKGELDLTADVLAKVSPKISADDIKNNILGKSEASANAYIMAQSGVKEVTFVFRPAFWKVISNLNQNVKVEIKYTNGVNK